MIRLERNYRKNISCIHVESLLRKYKIYSIHIWSLLVFMWLVANDIGYVTKTRQEFF